jgi:hypothetical protein
MNGSSTAKVVGKNRCPATPWANAVAGVVARPTRIAKQSARLTHLAVEGVTRVPSEWIAAIPDEELFVPRSST